MNRATVCKDDRNLACVRPCLIFSLSQWFNLLSPLPSLFPLPSQLDPLKVSGLLILPVGPNSRRAGGGSPARILEAAGGQGWGSRVPAARPPGLPGRVRWTLGGESMAAGRGLVPSPPELLRAHLFEIYGKIFGLSERAAGHRWPGRAVLGL